MTIEEISQLRMIKNEPCVSIIVPTIKTSPDENNGLQVLNNAIQRALNILEEKNIEGKVEYLINKLQRISGVIDYEYDSEGLGIFLSKNVSRVVKFPFEVSEKVFVGDEFETRDLVYTTKSLFDYYFLLLSSKSTRLFRGYGGMINEVIDENFPREPVEEHEYEEEYLPGSQGGLLKGAEVKIMNEGRKLRTFFMNVDYILFLYISRNTHLFVGGSKENLAIFNHVTKYSRNIAALAEGNYDRLSTDELNTLIKYELQKYINSENENLIKKFQGLTGSGKIICGIEEVWKAAIDDKVTTMLVEKDFICPAGLSPDGRNLVFGADGQENHSDTKMLDDAVNDLINTVINKGGDIIFVGNGKLAKYDKLAAVLK